MNDKELTQAIREGMNLHSEDLTKEFFWALVMVVCIASALFIGLSFWNLYSTPSFLVGTAISPQKICNYPYVECEATTTNCSVFGSNEDGKTYCELNTENVTYTLGLVRACGFQEANAWLEIMKSKYGRDVRLKC